MGHRLLLSLPAVAAAIVAWAVLGTGGGRVRYVQVLGGPTTIVSSLLLRSLELEQGGRVVPSPGLELRVTLMSGKARTTIAVTTDAVGQIELRLPERAPAEPWLLVETVAPAVCFWVGEPKNQKVVLAEGQLALSAEAWRGVTRRSGGWLSGQSRGTLGVRVAAESGTFAVPFEGALWVQVLEHPSAGAEIGGDPARPLAGAHLEVELDGAELAAPPPVSGTDGVSRVVLRPGEHVLRARVVARSAERHAERHGEWHGGLPVTPGALWATREGDSIAVRSPIPRARAFASIVTWNERLGGAIVPLTPAADGSARGRIALEPTLIERIEREASWVVVSSEHDKRSAGAVGWPLTPAGFEARVPSLTFDVADALLLDGRAGALQAAERERSGRRRSAALALLAVGLLMGASFWNEVRRGRGAMGEDSPPVAPARWLLALALGCILLGFAGLAYFGLIHGDWQ